MVKRALVLAGGGVAGISWELGVLQGIHDFDPVAGAALLDADVIVGTSAGSAVAAQITSGVPMRRLYGAQLRPDHGEIEVALSWDALMSRFAAVASGAGSVPELRRRIAALTPITRVDRTERRRAIAARVPVPRWPDRPVLLAAVEAGSGELVAFDGQAGVDLVDAVAASCAVPTVWPQVVIDGRHYIDGGVPSSTNAHLAAGCDRVLVVTPALPGPPSPFAGLPEELDYLESVAVLTVHADAASVAAFGANPLSPATRGAAARAGRRVGRAQAPHIAAFWRASRR